MEKIRSTAFSSEWLVGSDIQRDVVTWDSLRSLLIGGETGES